MTEYELFIEKILDDYDEMKSAYDAGTGDMNALVKDADGNVAEGNLVALYKQVATLIKSFNADAYAISAQNLMGDVWTDIVDRVEKMELMVSRRYAAFLLDAFPQLSIRLISLPANTHISSIPKAERICSSKTEISGIRPYTRLSDRFAAKVSLSLESLFPPR